MSKKPISPYRIAFAVAAVCALPLAGYTAKHVIDNYRETTRQKIEQQHNQIRLGNCTHSSIPCPRF